MVVYITTDLGLYPIEVELLPDSCIAVEKKLGEINKDLTNRKEADRKVVTISKLIKTYPEFLSPVIVHCIDIIPPIPCSKNAYPVIKLLYKTYEIHLYLPGNNSWKSKDIKNKDLTVCVKTNSFNSKSLMLKDCSV